MTCDEKLYTDTDVAIPITLPTGTVTGDVVDLSVTLRLSDAVSKTYTYLGGEITIVGDTITLNIPDTGITVAGIYDVYVKLTDTTGAIRGLTACPGRLDFYQMY